MYGHLNQIIRGYVIERHGEDTWNNIVKQTKCSNTFETSAVYDDTTTQKIVDAVAKIIGLKREPLLELIGEFYFRYLQQSSHDEVLRNLGANILDFIQNLDSLHSTMTSHYPEINAPSFRCDADSSKDRLVLHYYSFRKGYAHLVIGILRATAKTYYKMDLTIEITSISQEKVSSKHGLREHVVYTVLASAMEGDAFSDGPPTLVAQTKKHGEKQILKADVESVRRRLSQIRREHGEDALPVPLHKARVARAKWKAIAKLSILHKGFVINYPEKLAINPRRFCEVFPYHVVFSPQMKVQQAGEQLQKMMPDIRTPNADLTLFFTLVNPHSFDFTFENVLRFINSPYVVKMKKDKLSKEWKDTDELVVLKGQMIELPAENLILYLGSPFVRSFKHLEERGIYYADIAGHDVTRDLLFMEMMFRQQYAGRRDKSGRHRTPGRAIQPTVVYADGLDDSGDLRAELERTRRELEEERERNARLTHHFLPSAVAGKIRSGEKFDGGDFRPVTLLFCDIVNFLQYPSECKVSSVISLLNQVQEKFDRITHVHDTFRVESIGDAYVVASGIPDKVSSHVERVANTGLGMLLMCEDIKSPISWSHNVQIRMGMHTGSLKCGVVGQPIPRFVVMGETATIASRMESHGEPGRVHVTPAIYNALNNKGFTLHERGEITLRGLGDLTTYFLVSNDNATPADLIGQRSKDNQISFINEGNEESPQFNGRTMRSNKVKPAQGTPSSGVGSGSSRPTTGEDDYVPFLYAEDKQHKHKGKK